MTLAELRALARGRALDTNAPYLWGDQDWTDYANEAQIDASRRARLIEDSTTSAVCSIALVQGTASYALHASIIYIRRVGLSDRDDPVLKVRKRDADLLFPGWRTGGNGYVERYCLEIQKDKITFIRPPDQALTAALEVVRTPLVRMSADSDEMEINDRYSDGIVEGMLARAYRKDDKDTRDEKLAAYHEDLFTAEFGPKTSAAEERWINIRHGFDDDEGLY